MTWRSLLVVGILALAVSGTVSAQTPMGSTETVTGTVVSSSGGTLIIDTDTGRQTYVVDADSRLPANLAAGSRVTVDFHRLADGRMHAANATLLGTEPAATATTAPASTSSMGPTQTVTGTVITSGSTQIVLDTATGRRTFIVDADSDVDTDVIAGSRATVEYHTLADGRLHAAEVDLDTAAAAAPAPAQMASDLPQTASDLPTVGLVGLLALAAGLALRVARQHTA